MQEPKSEFLRVILTRGYLNQCTDWETLDALMARQSITGYIGFDATADSLHVGNLLQIMLLRRLQQCGHKPIILMGGGTSKIGDPSGRDESRTLLSEAAVAGNIRSISSIFKNFLSFGEGKTDAHINNNADWLDRLNYISFLRDIGRHFSINRMLSFDSVKLRLEREQPLSFIEFNYMILQAYDFVQLALTQNCQLQLGGSDQWGNIVNGVELGRKMAQRELYGLTSPLITTAAGTKMGKTAQGAVWLSPEKLSSYDYWQFWRNTMDQDVGRFLRYFTDLPLDEITRLECLKGAELNEAKIILANETTRMAHGEEAALRAKATAHETFSGSGLGADLPHHNIAREELASGLPAYALFARVGLVSSNSEARKLIRGGGARMNDQPIADENQKISVSDMNDSEVIKLSAGRKRHLLIRLV